MRVVFRTSKLRRAHEDSSYATRLWGEAVAGKYILRMEVIYAAADFDVLRRIKALRLHPLDSPRDGQWAMDLTGRWRLIVIPSEDEEELTMWEVTNHYGD